MPINLNDKERAEIARFECGFPWMNINSPAVPGKGIRILSEKEVEAALESTEFYLSGKKGGNLRFAKFVPASGAASRMFKDLFNKNVNVVNNFVLNIEKFAFYDADVFKAVDKEQIVDFVLGKEGLDYGSKPKGVLKFHKYGDLARSAAAEHLVEAAHYIKDCEGRVKVVFTISPEHGRLFEEEIDAVIDEFENRFGVKYDITFTTQHKWTDTLAVTPENKAFELEDGTLLHRPAGHGALIHNLQDVDADIVCIKNIDNVAVESYLGETSRWKKILIGTALQLRERVFELISKLEAGEESLDEAICFLKNELCIEIPENKRNIPAVLKYLNRPLRVCGMVRNEGEPGGGPFIINEKDGSTSLQILEGAQINLDDEHAMECLRKATHFNPVDLVCSLTDPYGKKYNLEDYVDPDTGLISSKSYLGRELKALELPGLWNGSMSRWNTVFVEVPSVTFNPVKTVMDLLRPAHQI